MSVRTAMLCNGIVPAGIDTVLATVPAGETWIVKGAEISSSGLGSSTDQLWAEDLVSGARATFMQQSIPSLGVAHYTGYVVLEPGHTLNARASAVDMYAWVSGSRLMGVVA